MKKSLFTLLACMVIAVAFTGCFRKGEDDPFISLRTRNTRLINNWKLTNYSGTVTEDGSYTTTYSYANNKLTVATSGGEALPYSNTEDYKMELDIKKDGTFNIRETFGYSTKDV